MRHLQPAHLTDDRDPRGGSRTYLMAEVDRSSVAQGLGDDLHEETDLPIPELSPITRKERLSLERPTIIRDFAYSADDPLFWRLEEPPDTEAASNQDDWAFERSSSDGNPDNFEGDGFQGAPPWLQSANDGGLSEEDHSNHVHEDELHGRAVALFDFNPEHENEFALQEGQVIYVSSRHGLGWLVAVDIHSGDCGLVPEEYVRLLEEEDEGFMDEEVESSEHYERRRSSLSPQLPAKSRKTKDTQEASEWVDETESVSNEPDDETKSSAETPEMDLQAIMDAAEREMAMNAARIDDE